jgi:hypothetical protein
LYGFTPEAREHLCLRQFGLESVGEMLFVNLADKPRPIDSQFYDTFLESVSEASEYFDSEVALTSFRKSYNWKLNFENVLDFHHPQFIHPTTFAPVLGELIGSAKADTSTTGRQSLRPPRDLLAIKKKLELGYEADLRDLSYKIAGAHIGNPPHFVSLVTSYGDTSKFHDWFIFPNVNFFSSRGYMFCIQQFCPRTASDTDYWLWVMTARRHDEDAGLTAALWQLTQAEKFVIDEDAVALTHMQKALRSGLREANHGDYESNLVRMLRWYRKHLGLPAPALP